MSRTRLPGGCRGSRRKRMRGGTQYHDLNVPIPRSQGTLVGLVGRLQSTGYGVLAFSHTIYGRPDAKKDKADNVLKDSIVHSAVMAAGSEYGLGNQQGPTMLRRLNAVVEELSDIAYYSADVGGEVGEVLESYDIVSISPRSDATFSSACSTANRADIIMLDYTTGRLPFKLKSSAVKAASQLGIAFELCYSSAILEPSKRKALVRIAHDLRSACRGVRNPAPRIILSSGSRVASGNDFGALALRAPGDLVNVLKAFLSFDDKLAADAMGKAAEETITICRNRRLGIRLANRSCSATMGNTVIGVDKSDKESGVGKSMAPALGGMKGSVERQLMATPESAEADDVPATEDMPSFCGVGSEEKKLTSSIDAAMLDQEISDRNDSEDEGDDNDDGFITFS